MQEANMEYAPADEAVDMGEQTVSLDEELFVSLCDLYDVLDTFLMESIESLDYSAVQEELVGLA
jgi:hypothetical protein